jgi:hypothetical protein
MGGQVPMTCGGGPSVLDVRHVTWLLLGVAHVPMTCGRAVSGVGRMMWQSLGRVGYHARAHDAWQGCVGHGAFDIAVVGPCWMLHVCL